MPIINPISVARTLVCGFAVVVSFSARAEVFLCETDSGSISLSNVDTKKNCKKMKLQPKPKHAPSYVQDKNNNQQNQLDNLNNGKVDAAVLPSASEAVAERKRIIQEELGLERARLEAVLSQIATVGIRTDGEVERKRFLDSAKRKESLHRSNITLLEKEISRIK